jgi:hypothetical protein
VAADAGPVVHDAEAAAVAVGEVVMDEDGRVLAGGDLHDPVRVPGEGTLQGLGREHVLECHSLEDRAAGCLQVARLVDDVVEPAQRRGRRDELAKTLDGLVGVTWPGVGNHRVGEEIDGEARHLHRQPVPDVAELLFDLHRVPESQEPIGDVLAERGQSVRGAVPDEPSTLAEVGEHPSDGRRGGTGGLTQLLTVGRSVAQRFEDADSVGRRGQELDVVDTWAHMGCRVASSLAFRRGRDRRLWLSVRGPREDRVACPPPASQPAPMVATHLSRGNVAVTTCCNCSLYSARPSKPITDWELVCLVCRD